MPGFSRCCATVTGCLYLLAAAACAATPEPAGDAPYIVVLGVAQDGGVPQAGDRSHPAWNDPSLRRHVVCLGLVDPVSPGRWLFEATPDIREQLRRLDLVAPPTAPPPGLDGIFLTHAHIGHYLGLAQLGFEAMGAGAVPVYAMPRLGEYLRDNGPWDQLVRYENIVLRPLADRVAVRLNARLRVTPLLVPHRQEYSEVVGFRIDGPNRSALFLPDIDGWDDWDAQGVRIEELLAKVDVAYLDATFFDDGEIPGRDMSGFPHPFVTTSMARFATLPPAERAKVRFIHFNHTNPLLLPGSDAARIVDAAGFGLAAEGERFGL